MTFSSAFRPMSRQPNILNNLTRIADKVASSKQLKKTNSTATAGGLSLFCHHGTGDFGHDLQVHAQRGAHSGQEGQPKCNEFVATCASIFLSHF